MPYAPDSLGPISKSGIISIQERSAPLAVVCYNESLAPRPIRRFSEICPDSSRLPKSCLWKPIRGIILPTPRIDTIYLLSR